MTSEQLKTNEDYQRVLKDFDRLPMIASHTIEYKHRDTGEMAELYMVDDDSYRLVFPGKKIIA